MRNYEWDRYRSTPGNTDYGEAAAAYLGTGPGARLLGYRKTDATPTGLFHDSDPHGRALITATSAHVFRATVSACCCWSDPGTAPPKLVCPPRGSAARVWTEQLPPSGITHVYAFDHGEVHLWLIDTDPQHRAGQWHTLDTTETHQTGTVWLIPEARHYGPLAHTTAHLALSDLARLLADNLAVQTRIPSSPLARCNITVETTPGIAWLYVTVRGLDPVGLRADLAREVISDMVHAHNWHNDIDTYERRIFLRIEFEPFDTGPV
ncbi:hypothetical protein NLX83_15710 [Allokutzneria sp. A3M-2-11 16]|uniref:hypothetical protein n=1 Tax=Allokutzneria sp. A3M-2-11 16 TaxID=2962043 RepID=UPI0020B899CD|nr:hypothetical protein [Allokutzneria sp. A3M-2-11 16]MCP3800714.1 hypothetical protein [Allokutzneria sp. A3M-2-11 16]